MIIVIVKGIGGDHHHEDRQSVIRAEIIKEINSDIIIGMGTQIKGTDTTAIVISNDLNELKMTF